MRRGNSFLLTMKVTNRSGRAAHTVVVYSWDARAARLRWLAKQEPAAPS